MDDDAVFCASCGKNQGGEESNTPILNTMPNRNLSYMPNTVSPQNKNKNKNIIFAAIAVAVVLVIGGGTYFGYSYYLQQNQAEQARIAAAEASQKAKEAQDKAEADKKQKEEDAKKELNKTQVKNAIDTLMNGEALLKSLADDINAGHVKGYSTSHWSRERTLSEINNESTKFQDLEPAVKQRIIELQNIQIQRVNAMYDGAAGNTYRFDEGGKKYDEFYDKLATLKKDFGIN
jgi:hypothetical protein